MNASMIEEDSRGFGGRMAVFGSAVFDFLSLLAILAFIAFLTLTALILVPVAIVAMAVAAWFVGRRRSKVQPARRDAHGWVIEGVAEER